jgi:hypothetical protein
MCILQISGPETPDPTQLDLFGTGLKETETANCSPDSANDSQQNEVLIRSPTGDQVYSENGKIFELNEVQKGFASSLHRKSRELVSNSIKLRKEENDLARETNTQ